MIATTALIAHYFPSRKVSERQLSGGMGLMNIVLPFFGGVPLCHGAGGLAAQYYFGARTGGANLLEGSVKLFLGLALAGSVGVLIGSFPLAILGAMLIVVSLELAKFSRDLRPGWELVPAAATLSGSLAANMAVGFACGLVAHYILFRDPRGTKPRLTISGGHDS